MHCPEAVIFDMDGLMIDSERVTYENYVKVMNEEHLAFDLDLYRTLLGKTKQGVFDALYAHYGRDLPMPEIYRRVYDGVQADYDHSGIPVKPGLTDLLNMLEARGIPCAVATSSSRDRVLDILEKSGLSGRFAAVVCGDDITRSKPDPEIFELACRKLCVQPERALVLEDSQAGIEAAYRAGIPVICVIDLKIPEEAFAKKTLRTVRSLSDVCAWLHESA